MSRRAWTARLAVVAMLMSVITAAGAGAFEREPASALSGSQFDPGYIISDYAFFNRSAMSEAEIQRFLEQRLPNCSNSRCLRDYVETTATREATPRCARYQGAPNERVSTILYKVQTACGISAKALLVTLQKEQGLVTASAPTEWQIRIAMGYGCPDTAPCDALYYGFFNQVYTAAAQFQRYRQSPTSFRHRVGVPMDIYLHPASNPAVANPPRCGTIRVTIRNAATAGLYNYTPYAPNAAALANLYGTGDSCSAYGNRNFWRLYNDWFGSPTTLVPSGVTTSRFDGADRWEVSAMISASAYPNGTSTVYVATGEKFPDGLAAAPAAARVNAPLLLTSKNILPTPVRNEIRRLAPQQIVVVGGPPSVSEAVYDQLALLAPSIRRDTGPDRYTAAYDIAVKGFPEGATTAYITRGDNFPDALSAGAPAGHIGAPILLVRPTDRAVPSQLATVLAQLGVQRIIITGSEVSVSGDLERALRALPGVESVERQGGADRYDAGLNVNRAVFAQADRAFIASGEKFTDAMSAAAVAGATGTPLILSNGVCTKTASLRYLVDAGVNNVQFLGSTATLRSTVAEFLTCG